VAASIAAGATAAQAALTAASVKSTQDPGVIGTRTGYGPPIVIVYGNGSSDVRGLGKAGIFYEYRLVCVGAKLARTAASLALLRTLVATVLATFRDLAGWQVVSIGPESEGDYASVRYLAEEIIVATYVSI
jgi:hypothetical protein